MTTGLPSLLNIHYKLYGYLSRQFSGVYFILYNRIYLFIKSAMCYLSEIPCKLFNGLERKIVQLS